MDGMAADAITEFVAARMGEQDQWLSQWPHPTLDQAQRDKAILDLHRRREDLLAHDRSHCTDGSPCEVMRSLAATWNTDEAWRPEWRLYYSWERKP